MLLFLAPLGLAEIFFNPDENSTGKDGCELATQHVCFWAIPWEY